MNKLWTFGCSVIAGCELGSGCSQDDLTRWWTNNTRYTNRDDFIKSTKEDYLQSEILFEKWWQHIKKSEDPLLSYGGQLAKKLNRQLISRAVSGSGLDRVLFQLLKYKDQIDWDNDLVIAELTPIYRYMTYEIKEKSNQQLALIDDYKSSKYAPSPATLEYLYEGVLLRIQREFPLVKMVDSGQVAETKTYNACIINTDIDMSVIAYHNNLNLTHTAYPGGHFVEDIHKQFADKLADLL